jgi:hypothetical protein
MVVEAAQPGEAPSGCGSAVGVKNGGAPAWQPLLDALEKRHTLPAWEKFMQLLEEGILPPCEVCDRLVSGESLPPAGAL